MDRDLRPNEIMRTLDGYIRGKREEENYIDIEDDSLLIQDWDLVFEGAQGILLDQNFGFFAKKTLMNSKF